ncbi:hypothetical protein ACFW04_014834 [Cataglyphis niger]
MYRFLFCSDVVLPKAYELLKIHKPNCPFRFIASSLNSPLYNLAIFITSLFTNIFIAIAIDGISSRWNYISSNCSITKFEFITTVRLILNSTYFTFNKVTNQQIFGIPMDSLLSPIITNIVLQDLEYRALNALMYTPPFYIRYVDDIALAAPSTSLDQTLNIFNSFHDRLNFLNVTIISVDNFLFFDWYHKSIFLGKYLHFLSNRYVKKEVLLGLVDRVILSHPRFHQKNFEFILQEHLKFHFHKNKPADDNIKQIDDSKKIYFTIPYITLVSEFFKNIIRDLNVKLAYRSLNKLKKFIKVHKDNCLHSAQINVVYKIICGNCDAHLYTRISEHKNHICRNTNSHSVITDHKLIHNHDFDWDHVKILDRETLKIKD